MPTNYDATLLKEHLNDAIRHIIMHCAITVEEGNAKQAATDLCLSTHTVRELATWWEHFGNREDCGIEHETPFLIDVRWLRAVTESPEPQVAHEVAHAEKLTRQQIRDRFPIEKWRRSPKEPVFKTTITDTELRADCVFRAFVDPGDVPPERWPKKSTMTITEKT